LCIPEIEMNTTFDTLSAKTEIDKALITKLDVILQQATTTPTKPRLTFSDRLSKRRTDYCSIELIQTPVVQYYNWFSFYPPIKPLTKFDKQQKKTMKKYFYRQAALTISN